MAAVQNIDSSAARWGERGGGGGGGSMSFIVLEDICLSDSSSCQKGTVDGTQQHRCVVPH